jgi:sulfite exporter TauE/SafE
MIPLLASALLAGLMGSPHCVAMCGAFASSCARVPGGLPAWHLGRVATYAVLGGFAGALGAVIPGPAWLPGALAAAFLIWFCAGLAGLVPEPKIVLPGLSQLGQRLLGRPSLGAQLVFGMANGLLPCGLVYSALSLPVALADPRTGALAMAVFGLGTLPALSIAALGVRRFSARSLGARRTLAAIILLAGLWSIATRTGLLSWSDLGAHPSHEMSR